MNYDTQKYFIHYCEICCQKLQVPQAMNGKPHVCPNCGADMKLLGNSYSYFITDCPKCNREIGAVSDDWLKCPYCNYEKED